MTTQQQHLSICFGFAVLNEEIDLPRCLSSVRSQDYPQDKVEIILADGGSTDRTVEIGKQFGCKVLPNPLIRAEPGAVLAHSKSNADVRVFFAADNVLPHKNWIKDMVQPFIEEPDLIATYTHISTPEYDNSLNKYYSFLHVEPFTWFVYGSACNPLKFDRVFPTLKKSNFYRIYEFNSFNHPLIALAQGFCVRRSFNRESYNHEDDIIPVIQMIEEKQKIAYVPSAGIYHFHLAGLMDFVKKYNLADL